MTFKLAIVVGHNELRQGATRQDTKETEWRFNTRLAEIIKEQAAAIGIACKVFFRTPGGGYPVEIERVYNEVDRYNPTASIELHFNGSDNPDVSGCETLISGTASSFKLGEAVQRRMVAALGLRDRGVKTRARKERGGGSLWAGRAPAALIEPFFGSSIKGTAATDTTAELEQLARAIVTGAAEAFDAMPRAELADSRTIKAVADQAKQQVAARVVGGGTVAAVLAPAIAQAVGGSDLAAVLAALPELKEAVVAAGAAAMLVVNELQALKTKAVKAYREQDWLKELR